MMHSKNYNILTLFLMISFSARSHWAFDGTEDFQDTAIKEEIPLPKDKILLREVKTLTFQRNKRTTSRRTHPIHQLSCVGGTAGCKLFTPDMVECDNIGYDQGKNKYNWRCHSDISDRVEFNHVEVICEGYDYPEDDYILLGSCGLEFTLDYIDPHDYHQNSYFEHMDDHEKEIHNAKARGTAKPPMPSQQTAAYWDILNKFVSSLTNHMFLVSAFLVLAVCSFLVVRVFATSNGAYRSSNKKQMSQRGSNYGPLTSAVLTTKKAC